MPPPKNYVEFFTELKMRYNEERKNFEEFLRCLEKEDDEESRRILQSYESFLYDITIPDWLKEVVYYGLVYSHHYFEHPANPYPSLPPDVVEVEEDEKITVNYTKLTDYLINRYCIVTFKKIMYVYKDGRFVEGEDVVRKTIELMMRKYGIADKKKIEGVKTEIVKRIYDLTFFPEYPFNLLGREFIPVENGVLWRENSYKLLPHSPFFLYTFRLPVKWDQNATCPRIEKFISEVVAEENQPILYEIPASCLLMSSNYHFAYMLVGSGSNGKSTYLTLVEKLLGKENIANVALQDLIRDKFKAYQLVGKLANIYADLPKYAIYDTGKFKVLTGGDRVTVERKYKDPFEARITARMIFSANELPEVNDRTYAFWRRWIVVEFPNQFPPNPDLIEELTTEEELSGFFNKVLEALTRIEIKGPTKNETVEKIMEEWMSRSNSVYAFVKERIEKDPKSYEAKDDVYAAYVEYCEENELPALAKNKFSQELMRLVPGVRVERKTIAGKRVQVWAGIRLKVVKDDEYAEEVYDLSEFIA